MVSETSMTRIIDKFVSVNNTKEEGFGWAGEKNIGRPAYPIEGLIKLYVYGLYKWDTLFT